MDDAQTRKFNTTMTFFAIVVNSWNVFFFVLWPLIKRGRFWYCLHKYNENIAFRPETKIIDILSISSEDWADGNYTSVPYFFCTMEINDTQYFTWCLDDRGKVIKAFSTKDKWYMKESIKLKEYLPDGNPEYAVRFSQGDKVKQTMGINFVTRRLIQKYIAERFVMYKLGTNL